MKLKLEFIGYKKGRSAQPRYGFYFSICGTFDRNLL